MKKLNLLVTLSILATLAACGSGNTNPASNNNNNNNLPIATPTPSPDAIPEDGNLDEVEVQEPDINDGEENAPEAPAAGNNNGSRGVITYLCIIDGHTVAVQGMTCEAYIKAQRIAAQSNCDDPLYYRLHKAECLALAAEENQAAANNNANAGNGGNRGDVEWNPSNPAGEGCHFEITRNGDGTVTIRKVCDEANNNAGQGYSAIPLPLKDCRIDIPTHLLVCRDAQEDNNNNFDIDDCRNKVGDQEYIDIECLQEQFQNR